MYWKNNWIYLIFSKSSDETVADETVADETVADETVEEDTADDSGDAAEDDSGDDAAEDDGSFAMSHGLTLMAALPVIARMF